MIRWETSELRVAHLAHKKRTCIVTVWRSHVSPFMVSVMGAGDLGSFETMLGVGEAIRDFERKWRTGLPLVECLPPTVPGVDPVIAGEARRVLQAARVELLEIGKVVSVRGEHRQGVLAHIDRLLLTTRP